MQLQLKQQTASLLVIAKLNILQPQNKQCELANQKKLTDCEPAMDSVLQIYTSGTLQRLSGLVVVVSSIKLVISLYQMVSQPIMLQLSWLNQLASRKLGQPSHIFKRRQLRGRDEVPAWIQLGLAEYSG